MRIFKINESKDYDNAIEEAFKVLHGGGIVVHPTDTCYGLAADITNQKAVEKSYALKKRSLDKPVNIIVLDEGQFKLYGQWQPIMSELLSQNTKRMRSFVVKKTEKVPDYFNSSLDSIGIQIPKHPFSLQLLEKMQVPLVATSANLSGHPSVYSISELLEQITDSEINPDLIIDAGILPFRRVSMVIEILINNKYKILRE